MPEREPLADWNIEAFSEILGTSPEPVQDPELGDGTRFSLGNTPDRRLELYPSAHAARWQVPGAKLELSRLSPPYSDLGGVIFTSQAGASTLFARVSREGEVTLFLGREPATKPPEPPAQEGPPERRAFSEPKEQPRLSLAGRVGATPSFHTTPKGTLVARFPLAVHESEKTIWHTVMAFGQRAEKLKDSLKKGDAVHVVGYLHQRQVQSKSGKTRTVEEIYAVVVQTR